MFKQTWTRTGDKFSGRWCCIHWNKRGVTLLEILCVLALISLAVIVFAGPINARLADYKLEHTAREIAWDLRIAREAAILEGNTQVISFYPDSSLYKKHDGTIVTLDKEIHYAVSFSGKKCRFAPSGAPAGGGTVSLKNHQGTILYVIVNPVAGRVRISSEPPAHW